jgi:membrane protein CcdC involved in cytochrome C biogenesis
MSNLLEPFNLIMWIVVVLFWATVILISRARNRRTSQALLILPAFFLFVGMLLNRYHFPWGTYAVATIHVMMLPALLRIAKSRP